MKKHFIYLTTAILVITNVGFAQQRFNVQNGTRTEFYDNLDMALQQAQAGDTIYLPSGECYAEIDIVIDKTLTLVGVGCEMNELQTVPPTVINRSITFTENANGSLLTGCKFSSHNHYIYSYAQNIQLIRNDISHICIYSENSNIVIRENKLTQFVGNSIASGPCFIENNVFSNYFTGTQWVYPQVSINYSYITNNVFTGVTYLTGNNCIIQNNYISGLYSQSFQATNNVYYNNAFVNDVTFPNGSNTGNNNLVNQNMYDTFEDYDQGNYHIKTSSPCKNAGIDGTDIGIYGGALPFKDGGIPFNPHIRPNISVQADSDGKLHINIIATSQDR